MKLLVLLVSLFTAVVATPAAALELSSGNLPPGTQWYVHVNARLLATTAVTAPFYEESLGEAFGDIRDELGIDLGAEVDAITVFGAGMPVENAAVLLHGDLSQTTRARLDEMMATATHFVEHDYGGQTFLEVSGFDQDKFGRHSDDDQQMLIHFAQGATLVTNDRPTMQRFLDGGARFSPVDDVAAQTLIVLEADRTLVQGAFNARQLDLQKNWNSSILSNIEQAAGVISENQGGLGVNLAIEASSVETAAYVGNVVQGLLALKALSGGDEPWLDQLVNQISLEADGTRVTLSLFIEPELAAKIVDEM